MGSAVSKSNKDYINDNWDELKCSPIGPFLQMAGIAPGSANETSSQCKSSEFSSQFNSSMTDHINVTNQLSSGMGEITNTMNKMRAVVASIQQQAFNDLSQVATQIFAIYVKIGNIFYVLIKNLINIMNIFKQTINFGTNIANLLITFINLLEVPVNGMISAIGFMLRK
jgi:hypothetical protein